MTIRTTLFSAAISLLIGSLAFAVAPLEMENAVVLESNDPAVLDQLVITGHNFNNGGEVALTLGGRPLTVILQEETTIIAEIPADVLPGSYVVIAWSGNGSVREDSMDVTIGAEGAQGPEGADGQDGANCYDGIGTSVADCIGPQGLKGDKGDKGDKGEKGDTGVAGADGAQGIQGEPGLVGTPGAQGLSTLIATDSLVDTACDVFGNGGTRVRSGLDANRDGILSETEVQAVEYVCNGADGQPGSTAHFGQTCPQGSFVIGFDGSGNMICSVPDVGTAYEDICNDGLDNDVDGLIDAEDTDCQGVRPSAGHLIITEIMADPLATTDSVGEYFEVLSVVTGDLNLVGCEISNDGEAFETIEKPVFIGAFQSAVFARSADALGGSPQPSYVMTTFLSNAGAALTIRCDGTIIDQVTYDETWIKSGVSIGLDTSIRNSVDNDLRDNWCYSTSTFGTGDLGTPFAQNDSCTPPRPAPVLLGATVLPAALPGSFPAEFMIQVTYEPIGGLLFLEYEFYSNIGCLSPAIATGTLPIENNSGTSGDSIVTTFDPIFEGSSVLVSIVNDSNLESNSLCVQVY